MAAARHNAVELAPGEIRLEGPPPDRLVRVEVEGGGVVAYVYGEDNGETVLCLNGGPGVASLGMREHFHGLARSGFRVVVHDQLGTGASDRPDDPRLWTLRRYVAEVEAVRAALGGGRVHLLGHSWGGWLAIEYAVTHPDRLKSCIFSCTGANMPEHLKDVRRLLAAFGTETLEMIDRLEAAGNFSSPLYRAICTLFYARHSSRKAYLAGERESAPVNMQIQNALWGPAEFSASGELAAWNRLPDLRRVTVPALVLVGAYDYLTPRGAGLIRAHLPDARLVLFPDSGHAPYADEPEAYFETVAGFLRSLPACRG
jgi:proline iminopeptidase